MIPPEISDAGTWGKFAGSLPFCIAAGGKMPEVNMSRLLEALIIAAVTMYGTVQAMTVRLEGLKEQIVLTNITVKETAKLVNDIVVSRAAIASTRDAQIADLDRRVKKLESGK